MNDFLLLRWQPKPKEISKGYENLEHIIFLIIFVTFPLKVKSWIFYLISIVTLKIRIFTYRLNIQDTR